MIVLTNFEFTIYLHLRSFHVLISWYYDYLH